jgi:hypothetical protein
MSIALLLQQTNAQAREQLRSDIRQTVREATQAAEEAARQAAAAAKAAKDGHNTTITTDGVIRIPDVPPVIFPGGTTQPPMHDQIPPQVEPISIAFFAMIAIIVVGRPLMSAFARRIDRGTPVAAPIPREVRDQLQQISQSVDAIAIEVERISEGQRFTTKMLGEKQRDVTMMAPGSSGSPR